MAAAKLMKMDGSDLGSVDLSEAVFDAAPSAQIVHDVITALQAAKRQGNAETKTRKEVRGGGAKPYRQKGTGSARHGSSREPQMRGGGVVFGPHKRSYRKKVPLAFRRKALRCVLSDRARSENVTVLDALTLEQPRTKDFAGMMSSCDFVGTKTLFVMADANQNVVLSARNLQRVSVRTASDVNALDVLNAVRVVVEQDALAKLEERLS
jgi:large subunit ribosomal protein L4